MTLKLNISINSGAALVIFVVCFFALLALVAASARVAAVYAIALTGLTGAFGGYLLKRNSNNKIDLEAERVKMSVATTVGEQK